MFAGSGSAEEPLAVTILLSLVIGGGAGFFGVWALTKHTRRVARENASQLIEVARREAGVVAQELKQKAEEEIATKRAEMNREYDRREIEVDIKLREIRSHEESLALLDYQLEQRQERLVRENQAIQQARDAMRSLSKSLRKRLEGVANMDAEEIKKQLREEVLLECQDELRALRKGILERSEQDVQNEGRRILVASMQRLSSQPNNDITATIVHLPSEEMKGRIIGREGRNIKSFEAATGVTLLIDESPQMVLISSFDPVRREVARVALDNLVKDGRIHPASIEEFVKQAQEQIELHTAQAGEDAVAKLNINGMHPELIKLLGRLKYRFSYTQNALDHSLKWAFWLRCSRANSDWIPTSPSAPAFCTTSARLWKASMRAATPYRRGVHQAFWRDPHRGQRGGRASRGVKTGNHLCRPRHPGRHRFSGAPRCRAETMTSYIQRLDRLEKLATSMEGVQQAYAIQAGREIRVVVKPDQVSDEKARDLAKNLRRRIEEELQYPSTIKITVIREQRFTEMAT